MQKLKRLLYKWEGGFYRHPSFQYAELVLLAFLSALNYEIFVFQNAFAPAGINGIATMVQYVFHFNLGYMSLIVNVPLLIFALTCLKKQYVCKTAVFVVLFSVLLSLLDGSGLAARLYALSPYAASLTAGVLEVSSGCLAACADTPVSYFLLGFLLGFAGLSVQCQIRALLREHPAVCRRLFTYRLLHGTLAGLLTVLLFSVVPLPAAAIAADTARVQWFTVSPYASLAMLAMCMTAYFSVGIDKSR